MTPKQRAGWIVAKNSQNVITELAAHIREAEIAVLERAATLMETAWGKTYAECIRDLAKEIEEVSR